MADGVGKRYTKPYRRLTRASRESARSTPITGWVDSPMVGMLIGPPECSRFVRLTAAHAAFFVALCKVQCHYIISSCLMHFNAGAIYLPDY